jgi:hypothetical protein
LKLLRLSNITTGDVCGVRDNLVFLADRYAVFHLRVDSVS